MLLCFSWAFHGHNTVAVLWLGTVYMIALQFTVKQKLGQCLHKLYCSSVVETADDNTELLYLHIFAEETTVTKVLHHG